MIGDNFTQELRDRGLTTPGQFVKVWDFNGSVGGPVVRDRIWFYAQSRDEGSLRRVASMFANANEGNQNPADPHAFRYVPDRNRPAATAASYRTFALRQPQSWTGRSRRVRRLHPG